VTKRRLSLRQIERLTAFDEAGVDGLPAPQGTRDATLQQLHRHCYVSPDFGRRRMVITLAGSDAVQEHRARITK
jgi:hypothetical protein